MYLAAIGFLDTASVIQVVKGSKEFLAAGKLISASEALTGRYWPVDV
jgi:hypothetical protein